MNHYDVIDTLVKLCPNIKDKPVNYPEITKLWIYVMNKSAGQELFKQSEEFPGDISRCSDDEIIISGWLAYDDYYTTMINLANNILLLKKIELLQEN